MTGINHAQANPARDEECTVIPTVNDRCPTWVATTYDNPNGHNGGGGDTPLDVVIAPDGERGFATGESWDQDAGGYMGCCPPPGGIDTETVAFDPATGQTLWTARYNGPQDLWDLPKVISLSPDGSRVYVAGVQNQRIVNQDGFPAAREWIVGEFMVLAYDAATGDQLWASSYAVDVPTSECWAGPCKVQFSKVFDLQVSPDGSRIYTTGVTGARRAPEGYMDADLGVAAFDAATGELVWSFRQPPSVPRVGPYVGSVGNSIDISPDGDRVFVTGIDSGVPEGIANHKAELTMAFEASDPDRLGEVLWASKFDGGNPNINRGMFVRVTPDGSTVLVAGETNHRYGQPFGGYEEASDLSVLSYDAATGERLWAQTYRGLTPFGRNAPAGLDVSASGDRLFVTGLSAGEANAPPATFAHLVYATVAYNTDSGQQAWAARHRTSGAMYNAPVSMEVTGGSVYVVGSSRTSIFGGEWAINALVYDAGSGNPRWVARYAGATASSGAVPEDGSYLLIAAPLPGSGAGNLSDYGLVRYESSDTPAPTPTSTQTSSPTPTPTSSPTPTPSSTPTEDPGERGTYPVTPNDPLFGTPSGDPLDNLTSHQQWAPRKILASQAWQEERATGHSIRVAVLDSGVDLQHEDLACLGKIAVTTRSDVIGNDSTPDDENGHGTHVAGIIGACTNNGLGIAGVAPDTTIVPIRVLNAAGSGTDAQLITGINRAVAAGVHVINMSLGYAPGKHIINNVAAIDTAIEAAAEAGVVLVGAAGNESAPLCDYPALAEDIVCVGATDPRDAKAWYSNFPAKTDADDVIGPGVVAPGGSGQAFCNVHSEEILSTYPEELDGCEDGANGYRDLFGTSMAAPHVAGVAALVYDRLGGDRSPMNAQEVINALITSADDLGVPGYDPVFGSGRIDALAAVCAVGPDCAEVEPSPTPTATATASPSPTESGSPSPSPSESTQPGLSDVSFTGDSALSGQYSDETLFEARLTDSNDDPIADQELTFELTGAESSRDFTATTDQDGIASVTPTLEEKPGPHQLTVRYAGDDTHEASSDTTTFVVDNEDTDLVLKVEGNGNKRTLEARLSDQDSSSDGISGRVIDFYADGQLIGSATTDDDGVATLNPPPRYRGGKHDFEARFDGDDYYRGSSDREPT